MHYDPLLISYIRIPFSVTLQIESYFETLRLKIQAILCSYSKKN